MPARSRRRGRSRRLVAEAFANTISRPLLNLGLVTALVVILVGVAVTEANATTQARAYRDGLVASGYGTLLIDQQNKSLGADLRSSSCDALGNIDGVRAAIWLRDSQTMPLWNTAGYPIPVRPVGGNVLGFLAATDPTSMTSWRHAEMFIDPNSTAASNRSPDEYPLRTVTSPDSGTDPAAPTTRIALTVRLSALGAGTSGNAIVIDPLPGPVTSCALLVDDNQRAHVVTSVATALPVLAGYSNRWILSNADLFPSARTRFEHRPTLLYWLAGAGAFTLIWLLVLRIHRTDHAVYVIAGLDPAALTALTIAELLIIIAAATTIAAAVLLTALRTQHVDHNATVTALVAAARTLTAATFLGTAWCWHTSQRTPTIALDIIKDR